VAALSVLPALAQNEGTLSTTQGASISDETLRDLLDEHIPTNNAHSSLVVLTQCYGGDTANDLTGRDNTAVLSATSEGETAVYGGYDNDAAAALRPGEGRTSDTVHDAGVAGKHASETPTKSGDAVSLEDTSKTGDIRSRHVLVYAGQPDSREGRDNDQRDTIESNFAGKANTTVTTVGGDGSGGWDHPGSQAGLTDALEAISEQMNENEQFILFVTDHGDLHPTSKNVSVPANTDQVIELTVPDYLVLDMLGTTVNDDYTGLSFYIEEDTFDPESVAPSFLWLTFEGNPTQYAVDSVDFVDINDDGQIQGDGEGYLCTIPVPEQVLLAGAGTGAHTVSVEVHNNRPVPFAPDKMRVDSGPIPKGENGSFNPQAGPGPNPPSAGTLTSSTRNLPAVQASFISDSPLSVTGLAASASFVSTRPARSYVASAYQDTNGNGQVDEGEPLLGTDGFSSDEPTIGIEEVSVIWPSGDQVRVLLTVGAEAQATPTQTALLGLGGLAVLGILLPVSLPLIRRRGGVWLGVTGLVLVLAIAALVPACATTSPGTTEGSETFTVSLTGVTATNADTGAPETVDGLPVTGATITAE
jgi:hypothetical protein